MVWWRRGTVRFRWREPLVVNRHRFWSGLWEDRHRLVVFVLIGSWPFWMVLPFAYLAATSETSVYGRNRPLLALMLGGTAAVLVAVSAAILGACLIIEWFRCRRVRVTNRGVCVRAGTDLSGFTAYRKIDRVEFGRIFVDDAAFPVLCLVNRKGKRRIVGLGTDVPADQLAAYLSECGVTVEWCENHQS